MAERHNPHEPMCRYCGSDRIIADATAEWDSLALDWVLLEATERGDCLDCGRYNREFQWRAI